VYYVGYSDLLGSFSFFTLLHLEIEAIHLFLLHFTQLSLTKETKNGKRIIIKGESHFLHFRKVASIAVNKPNQNTDRVAINPMPYA
jgi:hypothetical protein